jgi:hypothetical protein
LHLGLHRSREEEAMKCKGMVTELEIDVDEYDFDVTDAIVEDDHISVDWTEDGEPFHVKLRSTDGVTYKGNYGCPKPTPDWSITATRYDSASGTVLLLAEWYQDDDGHGGTSILELLPQAEAKSPKKGKRVTLQDLAKRVEALERDVAMLKSRFAQKD